MSFCCLVILSLIFALPSISLATMVGKNQPWKVDTILEHQMEATSIESTESGVTTGLRPWKGQSNWRHQHHLKNVHGILNIFGWGLLLPIGAIVARNFSKFPLKCDDWYQLHTLCQTSGYIVGAVGWGTGIWLGNSSRQYTLKAHRILGIIVFTLATLQMLAMWLQAKKEDECGKWWEICYNVLGYVVIVLSIANIFEGIGNIRSHAAEYWRWVYMAMLIVLALIAVALEIYRWIKSKNQQMPFNDNDIDASQQI
ncbi:hypothetical protein Gotur_015361 [Gossypium turneri]